MSGEPRLIWCSTCGPEGTSEAAEAAYRAGLTIDIDWWGDGTRSFPAPEPFTVHGARWTDDGGTVVHACGTLADRDGGSRSLLERDT